MNRVAKRFAFALAWPVLAVLAMSIVSTLIVSSALAQGQSVPSAWIDISATVTSLEQLGPNARRAASADEFWVGYTFALRDGVHVGCDDWNGRQVSFGSNDVHFYMEGDGDGNEMQGVRCDESFGLFLRFDGSTSEVAEARTMALRRASRRFDDPIVWAGEFPADASVAFLRSAVLGAGGGPSRALSTRSEEVRERLLGAVAMHRSAAAVEVVFAALDTAKPSELRELAVFWASQIGADEGLQRLIAMARGDDDKEVRQQSIFWLAQVAGERATAHLAEIAEDDPDTEVRQAAVFALSQSEDDAAVEALMNIVRMHDNPEVVKSALFWLGQSGDPRAVELIEELLFGRGSRSRSRDPLRYPG